MYEVKMDVEAREEVKLLGKKLSDKKCGMTDYKGEAQLTPRPKEVDRDFNMLYKNLELNFLMLKKFVVQIRTNLRCSVDTKIQS